MPQVIGFCLGRLQAQWHKGTVRSRPGGYVSFIQRLRQGIVEGIWIHSGSCHATEIIVQHKFRGRATVPSPGPDFRFLHTTLGGKKVQDSVRIVPDIIVTVAAQCDPVGLEITDDVIVEGILIDTIDPPVGSSEVDCHLGNIRLQLQRK